MGYIYVWEFNWKTRAYTQHKTVASVTELQKSQKSAGTLQIDKENIGKQIVQNKCYATNNLKREYIEQNFF